MGYLRSLPHSSSARPSVCRTVQRRRNAAHTATVKRSKFAAFGLYDLRHTWATRSAQAGVDLVTLAAMLGHSRIQMVLRYAHPLEAHQFAAMEKVQKYMKGE